ncbi:MAG TPA: ADP-ribosylglycohydrolase family protein [Vicinamibacteria bacterium]
MRLAAVAAAVLAAGALGASPAPRRLPLAVLEDKVRGGWAGQMIGVAYGGPTEFKSNRKIIEGPIAWDPASVASAIEQDDLYVEMTFAEVMDRVGLDATTEQYGETFKDSQYDLWHANAAARRLLARGIKAPWSGHPRYNAHANDIDFQIESDFIGLMTPGLPREANRYAERVGRVMNHGDGLYGGLFFAGMYAAAFFEADPRRVVEAGLRSIPEGSGYAQVIRDVLDWSARHPGDWTATWRRLTEKWDRDDPCPDGALADFNIDARLNGAFVALGLLYGAGDFAKTLEVSTRAGQDSDCNPSSAAGILGAMLGYQHIPERWKAGIPAIAGTKFRFTRYSFDEITRSTVARALKVVESAGGRTTETDVFVPVQEPSAPPLEQWAVDPPAARIGAGDAGWRFGPGWTEARRSERPGAAVVKVAEAAAAEATLVFRGSGVTIVGRCSGRGGRADVLLDGVKAGEIDAWAPPRTHDNDYWHVTGLPDGEHTVHIVTRGDRDARATAGEIAIEAAVVYGRGAAAR